MTVNVAPYLAFQKMTSHPSAHGRHNAIPYPYPQQRSHRRSQSPAPNHDQPQSSRHQQPPPSNVNEWNAELTQKLARKYLMVVHAQKKKQAAIESGKPMRPRMEICDDPHALVLTAVFELPGIRNEDVRVVVLPEGRLTISGERRAPPLLHNDSDPSLHRYPVRELKYGRFERTINVPPGLQVSDISANLIDGMLSVSWPRVPPNSPPQAISRSEGSSTHTPAQMINAQ